jgi:hypothetical protein
LIFSSKSSGLKPRHLWRLSGFACCGANRWLTYSNL